MSDSVQITQNMHERTIRQDHEVRELFMPYLASLLIGTEYEGKMDIVSQHGDSPGENTIIVGVTQETDAMNAYNGIIGRSIWNDITFRHDRDVTVTFEINMSDNDALWMFTKYLSMCLILDMARLSSSGLLKIAQYPANNGIGVRDVGARKIWTAKLALIARIYNEATKSTEIY